MSFPTGANMYVQITFKVFADIKLTLKLLVGYYSVLVTILIDGDHQTLFFNWWTSKHVFSHNLSSISKFFVCFIFLTVFKSELTRSWKQHPVVAKFSILFFRPWLGYPSFKYFLVTYSAMFSACLHFHTIMKHFTLTPDLCWSMCRSQTCLCRRLPS